MRPTRSSVFLPSSRSSINSSIYVGPTLEQTSQSSPKKFLESCSFPTETNERTDLTIIKRRDIETSLRRLADREDVHGVMVVTIDGRILYSSNELLKDWISSLTSLSQFARDVVRNLDPNDSIRAVRLRTRKFEIIITVHDEQLLIVMQIVADPRRSDQINAEEDLQTFLKRIQDEKIKN